MYILSAVNKPFTDWDAAKEKARAITYEVGDTYIVIPHPEGGWAVVAENRDALGEKSQPRSDTDSHFFQEQNGIDFIPHPPSRWGMGGGFSQQTKQAIPHALEPIKEGSQNNPPPNLADNLEQTTIYLRPALRSFIKLHLLAFLGLLLFVLSMIFPILAGSSLDGNYKAMLTLGMMSTGTLIFIGAYGRVTYLYYANLYTITPVRVESRQGILANNTAIVSINDIRTIDIKQTVAERFLKIGTLELSTAGRADIYCVLKWIPHPEEYHALIYGRRDRLRGDGE